MDAQIGLHPDPFCALEVETMGVDIKASAEQAKLAFNKEPLQVINNKRVKAPHPNPPVSLTDQLHLQEVHAS